MPCRRVGSALILLVMFAGCAPSYQSLKQDARGQADVYAFAADRCEGFAQTPGCLRFTREICQDLRATTEQAQAGLIAQDHMEGALAALEGQHRAPCQPGRAIYTPTIQILTALLSCGPEARSCRAEALTRWRRAHQRYDGPVEQALQHHLGGEACGHHQSRHAQAISDSQRSPVKTLQALEPVIHQLEAIVFWCPPEGLEAAIQSTGGVVSRLTRESPRPLEAAQRCHGRFEQPLWSGVPQVRTLCEGLQRESAALLKAAIDARLARPLSATQRQGFLKGVARANQALGLAPTHWPDSKAEIASPPVELTLQIKRRRGAEGVAFHTRAHLDAALAQSAGYAAWLSVVEQPTTGPIPYPVQLQVDFPVPLQIHRRETRLEGSTRYLAGHRRVENPEYAQVRAECERARRAENECTRARDRERAEKNQCEANNRRASDDYRSCVSRGLQTCVRGSTQWCRTPRTCDTYTAASACITLDRTPRTIEEEVWADHTYPIRDVTLDVELPTDVVFSGAVKATAHPVVRLSVTDRWIESDRAHGVEGDPLELPSRARLEQAAGEELSGYLIKEIEDTRVSLCEWMVPGLPELEPAARIARMEEAQALGCGDHRQAILDTLFQMAEDEARASSDSR